MDRFLPSVVAHSAGEDADVIVADNASTDGSLRLLEEKFPSVRVIRLEENYGFAEGYNRALSQVEADYFVLLNSDVEVSKGWLAPLTSFLDARPDVAAVQPKILKYDLSAGEGKTNSFEYAGASGGFLDKYGYPYCRGRLLDAVEEDRGQYDEPMEVDWASGACLVIRAQDYRAAGGLDAGFFAHHEEIDLCWRLRIAGKRIFCLPESKVWHVGGATLPQGNPRKTYLNYRNNLTMIYKNMPDGRLGKVLMMRRLLDNAAALRAFLSGNGAEARAIRRARKDFYHLKEQYKNNREMIQCNRRMPAATDTRGISILWQYFVRRCRTWSSLHAAVILFALFFHAAGLHADDKTRGIGVYPGRASEAFAPAIVSGGDAYRNLAYQHAAYHSSCYDYNLTAQLVTDGLYADAEPPRLEALVNGENLPKNEREYAFDGNDWNRNTLPGSDVSFRINWLGMRVDVDSIVLNCTVVYRKKGAKNGYEIRIGDGSDTFALDKGNGLPGEDMGYELHSDPNKQTEKVELPVRKISKGYRLEKEDGDIATLLFEMNMDGAEYWTVSDIKFFSRGNPVDTALLPMSRFQSAWMSETGGDQWVYVDLGDGADIDEVRLCWLKQAPKGRVEVSDDEKEWKTVADLPQGALSYSLPVAAQGRYVRVSVEGQDDPYFLSEMEVYGRGGTVVVPCEAPQAEARTLSLNGGAWRLQRASVVKSPCEELSTQGYDAGDWLVATVPATALSSFVNAGAVPNQNYDNNVEYASESYFCSDFFYRREFVVPQTFEGKEIFLNLDGINWKAQVWLNGEKLGRVEGAFMRGRMNITKWVKKGENVLLVEVEHPSHPGATKEKNYMFPGANGGLLGADNPTFHASVGWDWIPSVRGRETGIWNDIYLTCEQGLTLSDPIIPTVLNLPDTLATMTPTICWQNYSGGEIDGVLCAWIGEMTFRKEMTLKQGIGAFTFRPDEFPALSRARMRLWWPNGYGEPYLYDAGFRFISAAGDTLSTVNFKHGVRQMTYQDVDTALKIFVNGKRIVPMGGNWGFSEQNLNFRAREYDIAVRNHRDMNFNMIRNWVGQIGDDEFYDACDKYGIMVWQDFWLANPADGPDPADERLFENNALDYTMKIRRHPCIALYCGRNEGYPPRTLDESLRQITSTYHPGIAYISSSADDGVSGHGPYNALAAEEYFDRQTGLLHSERGLPNIMTFEGLLRTMRQEHRWPQGDVWGQHDYTMTGAQKGSSFNDLIAARFGEPLSAEQFTKWAQLINYEGYRAMYESTSKHRMGLLIWMSHSCWPSMSWQCYDYYFEPTGAYYGCRKACEPLHIQYNALTKKVEIVNRGAGDFADLKALAETYNLDGKRLSRAEMTVKSTSDSTQELIDAAGDVLRLKLFDNKRLVSENTYILAGDLSTLAPTEVETDVREIVQAEDGSCRMKVNLVNKGGKTAYLLRLNLVDGEGSQILPVWYSDNYFHLLPAEKKTVTVSWNKEDQRSEGADIELTSLNSR